MGSYAEVSRYLDYIAAEYGYTIVLKDFVGFLTKEPEMAEAVRGYYIHKNPYCMFIKSHSELWDRCQEANRQLCGRCGKDGAFFTGICYCGFSEIVIPVKYRNRVISAVCAGGFDLSPRISAHRRRKTAQKYGIDPEAAEKYYNEAVLLPAVNVEEVVSLLGIAAQFLRLYYGELVESGVIQPHASYREDTSRLYILSHALEYIRLNYANDIKVSHIAAFCKCSESYINHLFKKGTGCNINFHINQVRTDRAKELISTTDDSFYEISGRCGFSDPNYFSYVFKQVTGLTPSLYKLQCRQKHKGKAVLP